MFIHFNCIQICEKHADFVFLINTHVTRKGVKLHKLVFINSFRQVLGLQCNNRFVYNQSWVWIYSVLKSVKNLSY